MKTTMLFNLPDMSCGHCEQAVAEAALKVDSTADVKVDLAHKRVRVVSDQIQSAFEEAFAEAGYPVHHDKPHA